MKRLLATALFSGALFAAVNRAPIPSTFEPGERPSQFVAHLGGRAVTLTADGATVGTARMRLVGANTAAFPLGEEHLPGYTNYLTGSDPARWRTRVPNYARVRFPNVYPRIDVIYYSRAGELEFDFVVAPGGDPRRIRLEVSPGLNLGEPRILQGDRVIAGHASRKGPRVSFELARYDRSRPVVIDPVLSFATFAGSGYQDSGSSVAVDPAGNAYVLGTTNNGAQIFVSKVNAAGNALMYSTYLTTGGYYTGAAASAIAADAQGHAYIAANVMAGSFAIPAPSRCNSYNTETVAARLSADGASLDYATFICSVSNMQGAAIALDPSGNVYVATNTMGRDVTPLVNPLQPQHGGGIATIL